MTELVVPYRSGRIAVLADLHLDHWDRTGRNPLQDFKLEEFLKYNNDALIIAGDLINGPPANFQKAFKVLTRYIAADRIYILPGNHDYYRSSLEAEPEMKAVVEASGGHFVQEKVLRHGRSRLFCVTLWTDYALLGDHTEAMQIAERLMNDHRLIARRSPDLGNKLETLPPPTKKRLVSARDLRSMHFRHREWLEKELAKPHPDGDVGQTIVITHHGPHPLVAGHIDKLTPAFCSDLTDLLQDNAIDAWFFGHSHRHHRETIEGCDVRNVSIGYPYERWNLMGYLEDAAFWDSSHGSE